MGTRAFGVPPCIWTFLSNLSKNKIFKNLTEPANRSLLVPTLHLGFLASHGGSNMQAIIDACKPYEWMDEFPQDIRLNPAMVKKVKEKWKET